MKKKVLTVLFFLLVASLTLWAVFRDENPRILLFFLKSANPLYIIGAVLCVFGFILGESVILHYLLNSLGTKNRMSHCCLYSFIGFFYSGITPSASGGQPMQLLAMHKDGIPSGVSAVVLGIVTIAYKLVLVVIGLTVLVIRPDSVMQYLEEVEGVVYLGLVLNVIFIVLLFLTVFRPEVIRALARQVIFFAKKFKKDLNGDGFAYTVENLISSYNGTAEFFISRPGIFLRVFVMTVVQRMFYFFIIWFTYRAFGHYGVSAAVLVTLYAMISVSADMMPLPGGMGITESLFLTIFEPIFLEAWVLPAMIVSRGISFYTQLLICGIMTGLSSLFLKRDAA